MNRRLFILALASGPWTLGHGLRPNVHGPLLIHYKQLHRAGRPLSNKRIDKLKNSIRERGLIQPVLIPCWRVLK